MTAMDVEDLAELFRQYGDDVFRLAYSYLGHRADAEDVCQSVFLRLAEGKTTLLPGQLRPFWRRNVGELDENLPFREDTDRAVWEAVMALPPKYRAVIHLYYWEGFPQGEIGDILHISRTAVQTRMQRARAMLKKELSDDEGLPAHDGAGHAQ